MGSYSPYAIDESKAPTWLPGGQLAAISFLAMCFYIAIDVQVAIYRTFTKKQGLYFWSLEVGIWGIVFDAIGQIFKFVDPKPRIWPFYALALTLGWGMFSVAQLLVLYSRLHLVLQNRRIQRFVFIMALSSVPFIVVPIFVVAWPAWNPYNHKLSAKWSPRDAITERYSQLAFTLSETVISSLYIWSLLKLLRLKATVRQRRVMWDLIFVNALCITVDAITIVLVYVNQPQLYHPAQVFSYMLKFRLEFVVLNQLMAVAARGIRHETVVEKRYHHGSADDLAEATRNLDPSTQRSKKPTLTSKDDPAKTSTRISLPQPTLSKAGLQSERSLDHREAEDNRRSSDEKVNGAFDHIASNAIPGEGGIDSPPVSHFGHGPSTDTVQRSESGPSSDQTRLIGHRNDEAKSRHLGSFRTKLHYRNDDDENDEDEDEIGLHMWENNGNLVLDVPWFKSKVSV